MKGFQMRANNSFEIPFLRRYHALNHSFLSQYLQGYNSFLI